MDNLQLFVNLFANFNGHPAFAYGAVFFVLMICGFGVPLPEDITLVAGGIMAGLGYADVGTMTLVGLVGVLGGDATMFTVGRVYGEKVRRVRLVARFLTPELYEVVQEKFQHYGNRVLFVARFLPGLRSPIFLTAGMSRTVGFWRFLSFDGIAALISVPVWVYLGFTGANNREWLLKWVHRGQSSMLFLLGALLLIGLVAWLIRRRRQGVNKMEPLSGYEYQGMVMVENLWKKRRARFQHKKKRNCQRCVICPMQRMIRRVQRLVTD